MSAPNASAADQLLLRDLVDGLSLPGPESTLSVGIVGAAAQAPQPPRHCLRTCLDNDPNRLRSQGCPFLVHAAQNELDATRLHDGRCARGYQVVAQDVTLGGEPAVLVAIEGVASDESPAAPDSALLGHLASASRLVRRISGLLEENSGFANEVLQNYEQLNLIFELTQQIAHVADARSIEKLLLQRVGRLLGAAVVGLMASDGECRAYDDRGGTAAPAPLDPEGCAATIAVVRRTRQVQVATVADQQVIAGPLVRLDGQVDVVLAARATGRPPFLAGDMLLVESVLTFGGQIISNSELHERLRRMSFEVIRALVAAIDKKDHYTSGHSERVGFLTRRMAREFDLTPQELQNVEWAGLLHDIGKIGIPEEILCKPGRLTAEEFDVIKRHPRMGYEILKPIESFEVVLDGVLYHHEHPDGSGYPNGLTGHQIPLVARIIHVADTFDALTSTRSYRRAFSLEKAFAILREERGTRLDSEVVDAFGRAFAAYRAAEPADFAVRFAAVQEQEEVHALA